MVLNSGWKKWDKYLLEFSYMVDPIHILEIGAYEGGASVWFLENLMKNPSSTLTCLDTWEGSPEYNNVNFSKVEEAFDKSVKKWSTQVLKIKGLSWDGLIQLNTNISSSNKYSIIYVDASHVASDVMSDGILAWNLLLPGGILIFDDYRWDLLRPAYFTPKPAIDAFMEIMAPQIDIINIDRQVFLRKRIQFELPKKKGGRRRKSIQR